MMGFNPRDLRRAMKRMGISVEEVDAVSVVIELSDGSQMIVKDPQVSIMRMKGQPPMLYILGDIERREKTEEVEISDEDVQLVAEQAGVSHEEARRALLEAGGDIAAAILKIQEDRGKAGQT